MRRRLRRSTLVTLAASALVAAEASSDNVTNNATIAPSAAPTAAPTLTPPLCDQTKCYYFGAPDPACRAEEEYGSCAPGYRYTRGAANGSGRSTCQAYNFCCTRCKPGEACPRYSDKFGGSPYCERSYPAGFGTFLLVGFFVFIMPCCFVQYTIREEINAASNVAGD